MGGGADRRDVAGTGKSRRGKGLQCFGAAVPGMAGGGDDVEEDGERRGRCDVVDCRVPQLYGPGDRAFGGDAGGDIGKRKVLGAMCGDGVE